MLKLHIEFDIDADDLGKPLCEIINCKIVPISQSHIRQVNLDIASRKKESTPSDSPKEKKKYFCNNPDCKKEIDKSVVAWCLHESRKDRFGGKVYCKACQEGF